MLVQRPAVQLTVGGSASQQEVRGGQDCVTTMAGDATWSVESPPASWTPWRTTQLCPARATAPPGRRRSTRPSSGSSGRSAWC